MSFARSELYRACTTDRLSGVTQRQSVKHLRTLYISWPCTASLLSVFSFTHIVTEFHQLDSALNLPLLGRLVG